MRNCSYSRIFKLIFNLDEIELVVIDAEIVTLGYDILKYVLIDRSNLKVIRSANQVTMK